MDLHQSNAPKVSIIMPAYNAEKTIYESINSVLTQTYQHWELIIVDDASKDKTAEIIVGFAKNDNRIRFFTNDNNQGVATTRNTGIKQATGKYLAFLDSDDLWRNDKLAKQTHLMEETNAEISYTGTAYINTAGESSKYVLRAKSKFTYKELLRRNIMSCSSVMVQRDSMIEFPQGFMHEDYAVWLQIVKKVGHACGIDEPLLIYRMGEATKSAKRIGSAIMIRNVYRYIGYARMVSTVLLCRYAFHSVFKRLFIRLGK